MRVRKLPLTITIGNPSVMVGKQPKRKARPGVDGYGRTPLHYACNEGNPVLCAELLAAGVLPNSRDDNGTTPLWRATIASRGQGEVIALLRAAGADPYAKNNADVSPISVARSIANFPVAQFFSDLPADA
jgi:ankyrin repeat protein